MPVKGMTEVTVAIDDESTKDLTNVLRRLEKVGLREAELHEEVGVITGVASEDVINALARVPGVSAVERSQTITIPDPASDIQ
jgi:hypothetical protein